MTILKRIGAACGALLIILCVFVADVQFRYAGRISSTEDHINAADVALVLGASVKSDKTPSDALKDRLITAQALYDKKLVQRIFITGDDGAYHADEIGAMKPFLLAQGVPESDILIDGKGYRTYESCKHAKESGVQSAIIVTQRFHMARALYICNGLGLNAIGLTSDLQHYQRNAFFWTRDLLASIEAWWDVNVWAPQSPVHSS